MSRKPHRLRPRRYFSISALDPKRRARWAAARSAAGCYGGSIGRLSAPVPPCGTASQLFPGRSFSPLPTAPVAKVSPKPCHIDPTSAQSRPTQEGDAHKRGRKRGRKRLRCPHLRTQAKSKARSQAFRAMVKTAVQKRAMRTIYMPQVVEALAHGHRLNWCAGECTKLCRATWQCWAKRL